MNIIYTLHAEEQIKERKLIKLWVEEAIQWPDTTQHVGNKYHIIKKIDGKILKVVYVKEKHIKVITTYFIK